MKTGILLLWGVSSLGVFAQVTDPISGGAGWIGAGLLGAVLSWLCLVHLPAKDKRDEMKDKMFIEERNRMQDAFKSSLEAVVGHCEKELGKVEGYMHTRMHDVLNGHQLIVTKLDLVLQLLGCDPKGVQRTTESFAVPKQGKHS